MSSLNFPSSAHANKNLKVMKEDILYHLGMSTSSTNFKEVFGDVKFVCVGGSASRMKLFAKSLAAEAGVSGELENLASNGGRFVLFKVGPVIVADHGMGVPSLSILLHEMFKLLYHAGCKDVIFIRLGSSGGIGIPPGTLVITNASYNTQLKPVHELYILGNLKSRPAEVDQELANELLSVSQTVNLIRPAVCGGTICANDFYEEQARLDGAFCEYTDKEKQEYLDKAYKMGVRNFEMECTCFNALCHWAGFKAAIVCVTLVDRLLSDQVAITAEDYAVYQEQPGKLVIAFLRKHAAF
ncbi:unnamed protein product [Calicophoron daubneyi]|uniref:Nucleoside phosphorylase domain-containing protein n=1 Tax=Calicophoron daubneyi TaxID=300641 RepID=A0AAV2THU6_CALDB